jgi:hypothetical protein
MIFYHPDYTVGAGISPDSIPYITEVAGCNRRSGIEAFASHLAPKIIHPDLSILMGLQ